MLHDHAHGFAPIKNRNRPIHGTGKPMYIGASGFSQTVATKQAPYPSDGGAAVDVTAKPLYIDPPSHKDGAQGNIADCYIKMALSSIADQCPAAIWTSIKRSTASPFLVRLHSLSFDATGAVVSDAATDYQTDGNVSQSMDLPGPVDVGWQRIIVKVFAAFRDSVDLYSDLNYGYNGWAYSALGFLSHDYQQMDGPTLIAALAAKKPSGIATPGQWPTGGGLPVPLSHALTITSCKLRTDGDYDVGLFNVWATGGDDGQGNVTVKLSTMNASWIIFTIANATPIYTLDAKPTMPNLPAAAPVTTGPAVAPAITAPPAPWKAQAGDITSTSFNMYWTPGQTQDGFRLYQSPDGSAGSFVKYGADIAIPNQTKASVTGLTPGTTYYFIVVSYNAVYESASNIVTVKTLGGTVTNPTTPPVTTPQPFTGTIMAFPIQVQAGLIVK